MIPNLSNLFIYLLRNSLTDMASALFIMSMGFGSLLGPLLGGSVYDAFGGNVNSKENPALAEEEKTAFRKSLICLGVW